MRNIASKICTEWLAGVAAILILCAATNGMCGETSDPVLNQFLDLFIKKGFVTAEEVEKVKVEAEAMRTNQVATTADSKWKINGAIKSVELFGDLRVRYEGRSAEDPMGGHIDLKRFRYSARLGLRGEVFDDFYFGVRLDTAANPRSAWVSFGTSSSGTPYQGPFGKSTAGIGIGQLYLGWRPASWVDITVGKMPQPLYTTSSVWDTDLNPEGAAERFKYTVGKANFFATFGQFLYQDTNPNKTSPGYFNLLYNSSNPAFLVASQIGLNHDFNKRISLKIAPVLYNYTGHGVNDGISFTPDFSGTFIGQGSSFGVGGSLASYNMGGPFNGFFANQTGINNLLVLDVPFELNYRMDRLNLRLFGDYAQNLQGPDRARDAFVAQQSPLFVGTGLVPIPSPQTHDTKAYQVGVAIGNKDSLGLVTGSNSRKHAWEFRTYWQHVEQYALDPNLLDSDFFEGRGNMEGIYTAAAYGLTDNMIGTVRYGYARRINKNLGTGGSNQDIPQMNPIEHFNLLQVDLTLKF